MEPDVRSVLLRIVLDVVCLLIVAFPILLFYVAGSPFERGFFCDDDSLRHPYKDSTVPNWSLYIFGLGLPSAAIVATEFLIAKWSGQKTSWNFRGITLPGWAVEVYRHVGVFGFGAAVSQLITDIAKYSIGRLRPHFFDVCNPDVDCSNPLLKNVYITRFSCRSFDKKLIKDMRLSFPSGHSSFSMYCMIYLAIYLQAKITWRQSKLLKHVLQFFAVSLAFYTCLSRISDYKHHWSDVLSGAIIGILISVLTVVYVSDLFPRAAHPSYVVAESAELPPIEEPEQPKVQSTNSVI